MLAALHIACAAPGSNRHGAVLPWMLDDSVAGALLPWMFDDSDNTQSTVQMQRFSRLPMDQARTQVQVANSIRSLEHDIGAIHEELQLKKSPYGEEAEQQLRIQNPDILAAGAGIGRAASRDNALDRDVSENEAWLGEEVKEGNAEEEDLARAQARLEKELREDAKEEARRHQVAPPPHRKRRSAVDREIAETEAWLEKDPQKEAKDDAEPLHASHESAHLTAHEAAYTSHDEATHTRHATTHEAGPSCRPPQECVAPSCRPPSLATATRDCAKAVTREPLWAHASPPLKTPANVSSIDVVIAFCTGHLEWLGDYVSNLRQLSGGVDPNVLIYTKCNRSVSSALNGKLKADEYSVRKLPNYGRCDHTYAWHLDAHERFADLTLFLKDTLNPDQPQSRLLYNVCPTHYDGAMPIDSVRPLKTFYRMATQDGFACHYDAGLHGRGSSHWHDLRTVRGFQMRGHDKYWESGFESPIKPLGRWLDAMTASSQTPIGSEHKGALWPVCYGGNFAATRGAILQRPRQLWKAMERSLRRGPDSLEEGHFAERSWAGLLGGPLTVAQEAKLHNARWDVLGKGTCLHAWPLYGQLLNKCSYGCAA